MPFEFDPSRIARTQDAGRPICVPPMRRSDCQNEGGAGRGELALWFPQLSKDWPLMPATDADKDGEEERESAQGPMTDDEREAAIREDLAGLEDLGQADDDAADMIFLLRRLDELRAQLTPPAEPAHDWTAFSRAPRPPEI